MAERIETKQKTMELEIQANGIIRNVNGDIIARLGEGVPFSDVGEWPDAALKAKDEEIATLREQMHCACKEDENGAITSLCMAHRVAFTANQYADNADEVAKLREVQGELVKEAKSVCNQYREFAYEYTGSMPSVDEETVAKLEAAIERAEGKS